MGHNSGRDQAKRAALLELQFLKEQITRDAHEEIDRFNRYRQCGWPEMAWPTIGAAKLTKRHWLVLFCPACQTELAVDLTMKPRNGWLTIQAILPEFSCSACPNGPALKVIALRSHPDGI